MLFYLVKHSRPDVSNAILVLSKGSSGANLVAFHELLHVIKYGNYAGDPVNSRSISDFILYVLGAPVFWQSKGHSSMALPSSEAEWVALSVKENMFMI